MKLFAIHNFILKKLRGCAESIITSKITHEDDKNIETHYLFIYLEKGEQKTPGAVLNL